MANQGIEYEIYRYDDYNTLHGILPGRREPKVLDELKSVGGGSFRIAKTDPKLVADPTLKAGRNIVKVKVDGIVRTAFLIGDRDSTTVSESENAGLDYEIAGPGLKQFFDDARVEPYGGIKTLSRDKRVFNFASEAGSWYISGSWTNPVVYTAVSAGIYYKKPDKWPEKATASKWIWGVALTPPAPGKNYGTMPAGDNYFRYTINIVTTGEYAVYTAADDGFELYIDGEHIASADKATNESTSRVTTTLTAGTHVIAYKVNNISNLGPAALGHALALVNDQVETFVGASQASGWKVMAYPSVVPAWSTAEVLLDLIAEAAARGVESMQMLVPNFTVTHDSYGNAWPTDLKMEWSFAVGESLLSVVNKLEEAGVDIWIDPNTYQLNMVPVRGVDRTSFIFTGPEATQVPIEFKLGKHLRAAKTQAKSKIKNNLLLKTTDGFFTSSDAPSVGIYGRLEATLDTGASKALAANLAGLVFAQRAKEEEGASYDLTMRDYVPYRDFNIGDWVFAPNEAGLKVKRRIMSISTTENTSGAVVYNIEFDTIFRDNEDRLNRVIAKLGGGGVGGGLANNAGSTPGTGDPIIIPPTTGPEPAYYPLAPDGLEAEVTGTWTPDGVTPTTQVLLSWVEVTQDIDGNLIDPEYYEVQGWRRIDSLDEAKQSFGTTTINEILLQPFAPNEVWRFQVRAIAPGGTRGDWSDYLEVEMDGPSTPMDSPSAPTLSSSRGVITAVWSGTLGDFEPPPQFRYVYAELSAAETGPWQRVGNVVFREGRNITIPQFAVGTEVWVRLTAVDGLGLLSAPSAATSHIIDGITGDDIVANSVNANVLIAGSLQVSHVSPEFGGQLNIEANDTVQIIAGQAADAQSTAEGTQDNLDVMQTYYSFGPDGAVISSPGSVFATAIRNDRIEMLENGNVISYWNSGQMYVNQLIGERVTLGKHQIERFGDGTIVRAL
jgi:hypothetical protein